MEIFPDTTLIDMSIYESLMSYKGLNVSCLKLIEGFSINHSVFKDFINNFVFGNQNPIVINTPVNLFNFINNYLLGNKVSKKLKEHDKNMVIHVPIIFGNNDNISLENLEKLCLSYPDVPIVVWEVEFRYKKEIGVLDMPFVKNLNNIAGVVNISFETQSHKSFFERMLIKRMTFKEVALLPELDETLDLLAQVLIKDKKDDIYTQLDQFFKVDVP